MMQRAYCLEDLEAPSRASDRKVINQRAVISAEAVVCRINVGDDAGRGYSYVCLRVLPSAPKWCQQLPRISSALQREKLTLVGISENLLRSL